MIVRPTVVLLCVGLLLTLKLPRVQGFMLTSNNYSNGLRDRMTFKRQYNLIQIARDRELLESLDNAIRYKELQEQRNADALDEFIEDYANKKDINVLDKSVEAKMMKQENIMERKYYYDQDDKDVPCTCNSRIEMEFIGDHSFPRVVQTKVCSETQPQGCKSPYVCQESKYDLKILKWKKTLDQVSLAELPGKLAKDWTIEIKPISVGCVMVIKDNY